MVRQIQLYLLAGILSELRLVTNTFSKHKNIQPKKSAIDLVY